MLLSSVWSIESHFYSFGADLEVRILAAIFIPIYFVVSAPTLVVLF